MYYSMHRRINISNQEKLEHNSAFIYFKVYFNKFNLTVSQTKDIKKKHN